jgi:hypothetical protein
VGTGLAHRAPSLSTSPPDRATLRAVRRTLALLALVTALPACSTSSTGISIDVTAGQEMDAFTQSPAITAVTVAITSLDGNVDVKKTVAPGGTFDFGEIDDTEQVSVNVSGATADSTVKMTGASLSGLLLSSVVGAVPVFIQRTEQWARPPGALVCSHVNGIASVLADRFLIVTGGTSAASAPSTCDPTAVDGYDVFSLAGDASVSPFNPVPDTMVSLLPTDANPDTQVLLIAGDTAVVYDYSSGDVTNLLAPTGITWSGVAGGTVITATDGRVFVVGGARRAPFGATKDVLEIDTDGTLGGLTLSTTRLGAATTWVDGTGLVVAGGSATGPGLEVLGTTAAMFASINYPPDPVVGAGAVTGGSNSVVLFGGLDGTTRSPGRQLSTDCSAVSCVPTLLDDSALPALASVSAYQLAAQRDIVVGADPTTMENLTFVVDYAAGGPLTVTPIDLREPRSGATAIPAPNGTLALVGGQHLDGTPALSIETFAP